MPPQNVPQASLRRVIFAYAEQWWALGFGLAACFLVLLATKQFGAEVRVFCALAAIVVIVLWLATGDFRRDGVACAASSTLALLPIAALECNWIEVEGRGMALMIETFCLAILFVGQFERLGKEAIAALWRAVRKAGPDLSASLVPEFAIAAPRSRVIVVRCCAILLGLLAVPPAVAAVSPASPAVFVQASMTP